VFHSRARRRFARFARCLHVHSWSTAAYGGVRARYILHTGSFSRSPEVGNGEIDHTSCRRTQFVGGDTARACVPLIRRLREENKGTLLAYSAEVDGNEPAGGTRSPDKRVHKRIVQEMIHSINVAADFEDSQAREVPGPGRRTWVAIKMVSLMFIRTRVSNS
jgi:hypothetical protein